MVKTRTSIVNGVILRSVPINRKVKRYWISKYERIAENCGSAEAVAKFKQLRVAVLTYLADEDRGSNLAKYEAMAGFRRNGYLHALFKQADSQPHIVLSFLKLYTGPIKTEKSIDSAASETHQRLCNVCANPAVPKFLQSWLGIALAPLSIKEKEYRYNRLSDKRDFHAFAANHSLQEWMDYWRKWYNILVKGWKSSSSLDYKLVFPEIYKDYAELSMSSSTYAADVGDLLSLHLSEECPLSEDELDFVDTFLDEDVSDALTALRFGETLGLEDFFKFTSLLSGMYVGHVQHIHKKGGGTDYRDIAVPNRFIQLALVPAADRMYNLVRVLPQDATFSQDKFDTKIQNRVNNSNLYQGSVDLSKATDNLPRSWGEYIISCLQNKFGWAPDSSELWLTSTFGGTAEMRQRGEIEQSFNKSFGLFQTIAAANWEDEGYFHSWKVGQPLGSLPSFAMLSITHNLLLESMGAHLGLRHSPYVILGDDVVIFNKKLRRRYIRELSSRGIPLSLHKSFSGRLSEFAGKTYVHGSIPFYCSDHAPITWESLLDWQRSTGIRIPWQNLPLPIRKRIKKMAKEALRNANDQVDLTDIKLACSSYNVALRCEVRGKGSRIYPELWDNDLSLERISKYFEYRETDHVTPEPLRHSGITMLMGHPVTLMNTRFAEKDGYFQRFRPVELPDWYREKFRPCTTDAVLSAAMQAVLETSPEGVTGLVQ